tara:strand:- start:724 stop:1503 length:780 start_codon:yes stop_codon:yes gene_type:complete
MLVFGGVHPGEKRCNDGFTKVIETHTGRICVTDEHNSVQSIGEYLSINNLPTSRQSMSKLLDHADATIGHVGCFIKNGDAWYACLKCSDDTKTENRSFSLSHTESELIELGIVDKPKRPGCEILFVTKSYNDMLNFIVKSMSVVTIPGDVETDDKLEFPSGFIEKMHQFITTANKSTYDTTVKRNLKEGIKTQFHNVVACNGGEATLQDVNMGLIALQQNIVKLCEPTRADGSKPVTDLPAEKDDGNDRKRARNSALTW